MRTNLLPILIAAFFFALASCKHAEESSAAPAGNKPAAENTPPPTVSAPKPAAPIVAAPKGAEPARVTVVHVLIAFKGAERSTATRSKEEAEKLANDVFERAKKGEDFNALMKLSNDPGAGKYGMSQTLQGMKPGDMPRSSWAKGFADTGFALQVGEIGMTPYDKAKSPFGWHIIKRIE